MKIATVILLILIVPLCQSCKVSYSFTGANIHPDAKTVAIQYFPNRAPLVQPTLSQVFTEGLKDKFISNTKLILTNAYGDLNFEGEITGYQIKTAAVSANETAPLNRLTITVKVKFSNAVESKWDYNTSFSSYKDYDSSEDISSVEDELIKDIVDDLCEDIFNKAVANW